MQSYKDHRVQRLQEVILPYATLFTIFTSSKISLVPFTNTARDFLSLFLFSN